MLTPSWSQRAEKSQGRKHLGGALPQAGVQSSPEDVCLWPRDGREVGWFAGPELGARPSGHRWPGVWGGGDGLVQQRPVGRAAALGRCGAGRSRGRAPQSVLDVGRGAQLAEPQEKPLPPSPRAPQRLDLESLARAHSKAEMLAESGTPSLRRHSKLCSRNLSRGTWVLCGGYSVSEFAVTPGPAWWVSRLVPCEGLSPGSSGPAETRVPEFREVLLNDFNYFFSPLFSSLIIQVAYFPDCFSTFLIISSFLWVFLLYFLGHFLIFQHFHLYLYLYLTFSPQLFYFCCHVFKIFK